MEKSTVRIILADYTQWTAGGELRAFLLYNCTATNNCCVRLYDNFSQMNKQLNIAAISSYCWHGYGLRLELCQSV